jgi:hypothetical protein
MSHSEARFPARMLFGRTRTLSDEQRSEQSERAQDHHEGRAVVAGEDWTVRGQDPQPRRSYAPLSVK